MSFLFGKGSVMDHLFGGSFGPPEDGRPNRNRPRGSTAASCSRIQSLRNRLSTVLADIRNFAASIQRNVSLDDTATQKQCELTRELFDAVEQLVDNGHFLEMLDHNGPTLRHAGQMENTAVGLRIRSTAGDWYEEFEDYVRDRLNIHEQIRNHQQPTGGSQGESSCPRTYQMTLDGSGRVCLTPTSCRTSTNSVYGLRCRLCPARSGPDNISYVGKNEVNERSGYGLHNRVCTARRSHTVRQIGNTSQHRNRPLIKHVADHYKPEEAGSSPNAAFQNTVDVILLPTGEINTPERIRNWEVFWQWFLHAREDRGGFSQR